MRNAALLISIVILACGACKSSKSVSTVQDYRGDTIILQRTPCFGTCPQFTLTITGSGQLLYEGKRFSPMNGVWSATVSTGAVDSFFREIYTLGYAQYAKDYPSPYSDLPSVILNFKKTGEETAIKVTGDRPDSLDILISRIEEFGKKATWINQNHQ